LTDADRVRAHRARQRGEAEPPTFVQVSAGDEELALALQREQALTLELAGARQGVRRLEHELAEAETRCAQLDSELSSLRREREEMLVEIAELNERVLQPLIGLVDTQRHEPSTPRNRAARRRAARRRRP
jgi:chromosome segregation ATPase